jgi:hypothetical protein
MRLWARRTLVVFAGLAVPYGLTLLLGVRAAERALLNLDQARVTATAVVRWGVPLGAPLPSELVIERFETTHWVALPLLVYCEGQSYTRNGPVADTIKPSLVLWYGVSASVIWQSKEWLPGRSSRIQQLAETGY